MEFRDFLRDWLAQPGRSAYKLALASGVSQSVIGRYVHPDPNRRVQPTPASLERLAPALGISHEDLMRMSGYLPRSNSASAHPPAHGDERLTRIMRSWHRLPEYRRQSIADLADYREKIERRPRNSATQTHKPHDTINYVLQAAVPEAA